MSILLTKQGQLNRLTVASLSLGESVAHRLGLWAITEIKYADNSIAVTRDNNIICQEGWPDDVIHIVALCVLIMEEEVVDALGLPIR